MFTAKLGMKVLNACKTLTYSLIHKNPCTHNTNTCGLGLKTLESDTFTKCAPTAVTKATLPTAPAVFEGSQVPMHHQINGASSIVRESHEAAISSNPLTDPSDTIYVKNGLLLMLKLDKAFAKLPPLEKNCIVWRGRSEHPVIKRFNRDFGIIDNANIGDIIIPDRGYSYTGFTKELASHWSSSCGGRTMMFKIRLPKGAKVSRNLEHGGEVVMPRNAEYRLLSKSTNGNHTEVELEYILPKKDNVAEIEELMQHFHIEPEAVS